MTKGIFRYYVGIIIAIIAAVLLELLVMYTNPPINKDKMPSDKQNVYSSSNITTDGYTVNGNTFTPTSKDPKLFIDLSGYKGDISSISVNLENSFKILTSVQIYYSTTKSFSESKSTIVYIPTYSYVCMDNIPKGNYKYLRIDINSEFTLDSVDVSPNKLQVLSELPHFSYLSVFALFLAFALINFLLIYFNITRRIAAWFKRIASVISNEYLKIFAFLFFSLISCGLMSLIITAAINVMDKPIKSQYYVFACVVGLLISSLFVFRNYIGDKPERFFVLIFLSASSLICIYSPFGSCWDDQIHYSNALSMSFIGDGMYTQADLNILYYKYPLTFSDDANDSAFKQLQEDYDQGAINTQSRGSIVDQYRKIGYTGCAVGLFIGRCLSLPFKWIYIFGKLGNMLQYCIVIYFAIKKLKSGKMILTAIALLPTQVFLASSYTYDAWLTSFFMLGFAYFFSEVQDPYKKLKPIDWIIIVGSFLVGTGLKAVYFAAMGILLLMPKTKFKSEKACKWYRFSVCIVAFLLFASFALPFVIKGPGSGDSRGGTTVNALGQVEYILNNPLKYAKTFFNFIKGYLSFEQSKGYMNSLAYIGDSDHHLVLLVLLAGAALTDKNEYDEHTSKISFKLATAFFCFVVVSLVVAALYISFNAVGSDKVEGCQLRYLLPLVFPMIYVIGFPKIRNYVNKTLYNSIVFGASGFVLFNTLWDLYIKKFI